jgi:predicted nucleic acid-binding protein
MKIYIDTGVFLDYLAHRGNFFLRTAERRGRTIEQLSDDAFKCLKKINEKHEGFTSSLMLYEAENTMYETLKKHSAIISDKLRYIVTHARSLTTQILCMLFYHDHIQVIDLTQNIFEKTVSVIELQKRAIEAADSIHLVTAIMNNAEIIISTDDHILNLDRILRNTNGIEIQCLDTDAAFAVL